jgi:SAM-dependent methyltransferase
MRWIAKAAAQRLLGAVSGGDQANYLLQRYVTRQLPRSYEHFRLHATETLEHFAAFEQHLGSTEVGAARFYEFGAGWDLITPLVYYALGVDHQTLVDIRPNLRFDQVDNSIAQYQQHQESLTAIALKPLRPIDGAPVTSPSDLEDRFGIRYLAPKDARATRLASESFDFASSTFTLEHIPRDDIAAILTECRRLLRPGGVMSSAVDMQDHYSFFDPKISAYNFLKFSERVWTLANSPLHYQNRLRRSDYRALHEAAGFEVVEEAFARPTKADLVTVSNLKPAARFRAYPAHELAVRAVRVVGVRPV